MAKPKKPGFGSAAGQWTLDAKLFNQMVHELGKQFEPPVGMLEVLEAEVLSVLQLAAKKTKRVKLTKVKGKYNPGSKHYNKYVRIDGRLYPTKPTGRKYSASFQSRIARRMKFYKERAMDRVGLSKALYYKIAKDDLKLKGYNRHWHEFSMIQRSYNAQYGKKGSALRSRGRGVSDPPRSKSWKDSSKGAKNVKPESLMMHFSADTLNTLNPFTKGMGAFQSALNGRVGQFNLGMRRGFFDDSKWVAERYPNVKVTE